VTTKKVSLFPLRTVLFPGGPLPLRVFEPRYLDMISRCMKNDEPFGVVLLAAGLEAGSDSIVSTSAIGTLATINDWFQGTDGLLGITALGGERFQLQEIERQSDGLNIGRIEVMDSEPEVALPSEYASMSGLLHAVIDDLGKLYEKVPEHYADASWVGFRFAEILPLELQEQQACLEMRDPIERLELLRPCLRQFREQEAQ
jgi:Lon protease-like protein